MKTLERSEPYFVRCIKPNANKVANRFDASIVLSQLRYTGMLETIRIRSLGYALRQTFDEFYGRYYIVKRGNMSDLRTSCTSILESLRLTSKDYQIGKTMVFVRNDASRQLEHRRSIAVNSAGRKIATFLKMVIQRKQYLATRKAAIRIQSVIRGALSRFHYQYTRECVLDIQRMYRGHLARRRLREIRQAVPRVVSGTTTPLPPL